MKHNFCPYCMTPVEEGKPCGACGLTQGSYTPSPHHLPPGTVLKERYLVGRVLGEGGFGITYIGCDLQLELKVAIKEYFPTDKASRVSQASLDVASYTGAAGVNYDKGLEKFLQEARTIARMDKQPVIVNVRDFFEVNHTAYIVMEYVEGTTFKDLAEQRGGRIPAGELLYLMEPLFFALKEMHANGLIHRDISPENLMIEKGEVRLLDFGCARESADGGNTLTIALKHGYAPVEQYQSKGQGPWTDVYALSATIYYCLTGRKPPQAMDRLVEDELIPPRKLGVDLTQRQENALLHGMAVPPKRRYQSMEEFHTALYEGFVPGAVEADGKAEPDVPVDGLDTGSPDTAEKTVETPSDAGKAPFDLPAWLKQNRLLAGGIAAALALVILLAAVLPRLLGPSSVYEPDPTQTVEPSEAAESPSPSPEPTQTPVPTRFSQNNTQEENAAVLLAQLADDGRATISIPVGVYCDVYESVTLNNKTLRISPNSGVYFNAPLVIGEGGRVEIGGSGSALDGNAAVRTTDGGKIEVGAGGRLQTNMLWLEREDDLTCAPDGWADVWDGSSDPTKGGLSEWAQSHYLVLDIEELFADAIHVTTEEEFAARCQGDTPIVVDGDITLTEYRYATAPILVSEGAVLNAPADEHGDCTLDTNTILVNDGELLGRVSLINFDDNESMGRLINRGRSSASLNAYNWPSTILNLGELSIRYGEIDGAALSNLGTLTVADGEMNITGNWHCNAGTITIAGGGTLATMQGAGWNNYGDVLVEDGGKVINGDSFLSRAGTVQVAAGGVWENTGLLSFNIGTATMRVLESGTLDNSGVIASGYENRLELAPNSIFTGEGHMIPFAWDSEWGDDVRWVETEDTLRAALADPAVALVIWSGPEEAVLNGGSLTVNKGLAFPGGTDSSLTVKNGGITVDGEGAFLYCDRFTDLTGGELNVTNGGTAVMNDGITNAGKIAATDGGLIYPENPRRD